MDLKRVNWQQKLNKTLCFQSGYDNVAPEVGGI